MSTEIVSGLRCVFLGAGKMGEAILAGALDKGLLEPAQVGVVEACAERAAYIRDKYGVRLVRDAAEAVGGSETVVLAVKPQDLDGLLSAFPRSAASGRLFISIAAGKTLAWLEERLPRGRVVRVMPNLAMRVGEGMSAYCPGVGVREEDREAVEGLLGASGEVREIEESFFDAVTALSGSGPAFLAFVLRSFVRGAEALGLPGEDASALALQTMKGTAKVLSEGEDSLDDFIKAVTSAKGTTAAGLEVLENSELSGIVAATLAAAARRSLELSG